jgi:hypothetical protein
VAVIYSKEKTKTREQQRGKEKKEFDEKEGNTVQKSKARKGTCWKKTLKGEKDCQKER